MKKTTLLIAAIFVSIIIYSQIPSGLPSWITNVVYIENNSQLNRYPSTPTNNTAYLFRAGQTFNINYILNSTATDFYVGSTDVSGDSLAYIVSTLATDNGKIFSGSSYRNACFKNLSLRASFYTSGLSDLSGVVQISHRNKRVTSELDSDLYIENVHMYGGLSGMRCGSFGDAVELRTDVHITNSTVRRCWGDNIYLDYCDSVFIYNIRTDSVNLLTSINPAWIGGDAYQQEYAEYVSIKNSEFSHASHSGKFAFIANGTKVVDARNSRFIGWTLSATIYGGGLGPTAIDEWSFKNCIIENSAKGFWKHSDSLDIYNCVFKGLTEYAFNNVTNFDSITIINCDEGFSGTISTSKVINRCIFDNVTTPENSSHTLGNNYIGTPTYLDAVYNTTLPYGAHIDINNFGYDPSFTGLPPDPDPDPDPDPVSVNPILKFSGSNLRYTGKILKFNLNP